MTRTAMAVPLAALTVVFTTVFRTPHVSARIRRRDGRARRSARMRA